MLRSLRQLNFNSSRVRLLNEVTEFAKSMPAGALMLDAGAGDGPYRSLFNHVRYESADFEQVDKEYQKSTYVCDLSSIPVEDNRFDFIIFNQVMEHLPEPAKALNELNRILKPGGKLLYSAPLFIEEHEQPYDFYRYTQFAIRHLFTTSGFEVERLDWLEGYFGTVAYQFNTMFKFLPTRPADIAPGFAGYALAPFVFTVKSSAALSSLIFHRLERRHKYTRRGYPKNYVGVMRKLSGEPPANPT